MPKIQSFSSKSIRKWTIAFAHWKSYEYLFWQLKMLYNYNNPHDFELCIFDGMFPYNDLETLQKLISDYKNYHNIKLFFWENLKEKGVPHGSELTEILSLANSKYILFNDPDCFWLVKGHLNFLEHFLNLGYKSVGVQHRNMKGPAIYGSAYHVKDIVNCNLSATWLFCEKCQHKHLVKDQDTGWQLYIRTLNTPSLVFKESIHKTPSFGKYSHGRPDCYQSYEYQDKIIATHLFMVVYKEETPDSIYPDEWLKNRTRYGKYFYENCNLFNIY